MKRILSIVALAIFSCIAARATDGGFDEVSISCAAVTTTGACAEFHVHPPDYVHVPSAESFTWQTIIAGGTATSISVTLQGSVDDVTWSTLDTSTNTSGETRTKGTAAIKFFRCNVGAYSRNGTTLTCQIMPTRTSGSIGGSGTVTGVSGTTNQITSDGSSTTPTLSIPSTFVAPGTISAVTSIDATKLLGNLPALNGSALTNLPGGTVTSVTGTASQITSTGTATPVLSIPSAFIAPGTISAVTSIDATKLLGNLPALNGSALTGITGTLPSGTRGAPLINTNGSTGYATSPQTVDASAFTGTHWTDKVVSANTFLGAGGGTIIVPDSIADDGHTTAPTLGANTNLHFTGSAYFTECTLNAGKFSHIWGTVTLGAYGSNCSLISQTNYATMQEAQQFIVDGGLHLDCAGQTACRGLYIGAHASSVVSDITVTGATGTTSTFASPTAGIVLYQTQYLQMSHVNSWGNYVDLKLYAGTIAEGGGGSSNTFYSCKFSSSTVGVIMAVPTSTYGAGNNVFINPQMQGASIAEMAVIGRSGLPLDVHLYGAAPEMTSAGTSTVTIDGDTISQSSVYGSYAIIDVTDYGIAEAAITPVFDLVNSSILTAPNLAGYGNPTGTLVQADSTSSVVLDGALNTIGAIQNVVGWPSALNGQSYLAMAGTPVLKADPSVPNAYSGNPQTPVFSDTTGTSSHAIAQDPFMGTVNTVTFAASVGSYSGNYIGFNNIAGSPGFDYDALASVMVMSNTTGNFFFGADSFSQITTPLIANQWTRLVFYTANYTNGSSYNIYVYPTDSNGATVSFSKLEVLAEPKGSLYSRQYTNAVLKQGAVNLHTNNSSSSSYALDTGSSTVYAATPAPALSVLLTGQEFDFLPAHANTSTTPTLNLGGTGAKTITKLGTTALALNDLTTTAVAKVIYDGTGFQLLNPESITNTLALGTDNSVAGTLILANSAAAAHTTWGSGATTTNTINGPATVPTTGHLLDCTTSSTTCLLHDSGVVTGDAITYHTPATGIARTTSSSQAIAGSELSGVVTTSGSNVTSFASSPSFTTPNIGAATGTSLLVTGIVDGTVPVTATTGASATLGAATYKSGYTFNQEATAGTGVTYTLPATAVGLQYCVKNSIVSGTGAADTGVLTVYPPASSYIILNGARNTIGGGGTHGIASGGAAGDAACFVAVDATDWEVYVQKGTWTAN